MAKRDWFFKLGTKHTFQSSNFLNYKLSVPNNLYYLLIIIFIIMISLGYLFLVTKQKWLPKDGIGCLKFLQTLLIYECENLENLCEDMQGLEKMPSLLFHFFKRLLLLGYWLNCISKNVLLKLNFLFNIIFCFIILFNELMLKLFF